MTPILDYLQNNTLPTERDAAQKLKATSARFTIIQGKLYRMSFSGPYLICIKPSQVKTILSEIHEGECGNHSRPRSLAHKIITTGYYWPTLQADCKEFTKKCDKCQRFANMPNQPPERLIPITSPWPFMKWGMDIVGKMPIAPGQRIYMLALTDYFTKWVEAEAFHQVRDT